MLEPLRRGDTVTDAAAGTDLLVIATPDDVIAEVAGAVRPVESTLVAHLSGSLPLEVLSPHPRRASFHPLASLPDADTGARTLLGGCAVAIAGDPQIERVATDLGARAFEVPDDRRALYHATAVVAANHVVALLGQVERLAAACEVPVDGFLEMAGRVVANAREVGAAAALTGPAARGDVATIRRHVEALPPQELTLYRALASEAAATAGADLEPAWP